MKKRPANDDDRALYSRPKPIELPSCKIISIDPKAKEMVLEGSPPKELADLEEFERRRLNFMERFNDYYHSMGREIAVHFGEDSEYFAASKAMDYERLKHLVLLLPRETSPEGFFALEAMVRISAMNAILSKVKTIAPALRVLLCETIDLEHVPLSSSVRPHSPIPTGNKEVEAVLCGGGVE